MTQELSVVPSLPSDLESSGHMGRSSGDWQPWKPADKLYTRPFRLVFWLLALPFGLLLVPTRNFAEKRPRLSWLVWLCNNTPNGMSILRGAASAPVVVITATHLWDREPQATTWFIIVIGLFALDGIDGPLARMLDHVTEFGKKADPVVDKVLMAALALAAPSIIWHLLNPTMAIAGAVMIVFLLITEVRVAQTSIENESIAKAIGREINGAFMSGKIKFNLEAIGFLVIYGYFRWAPSDPTGLVIGLVALAIAHTFAKNSLVEHQAELSETRRLRDEALGQKSTSVHIVNE